LAGPVSASFHQIKKSIPHQLACAKASGAADHKVSLEQKKNNSGISQGFRMDLLVPDDDDDDDDHHHHHLSVLESLSSSSSVSIRIIIIIIIICQY